MNRFNIRVYGIIISNDMVLVSDEHRFGRSFTKFPGGGLEWGEGLKDALVRELKEELDIEAEVKDLFYVNDFFQQSTFRDRDQLLSFYFRVALNEASLIPDSKHDVPLQEDGEFFRWIRIQDIDESIFTFPIDKHVSGLLQKM